MLDVVQYVEALHLPVPLHDDHRGSSVEVAGRGREKRPFPRPQPIPCPAMSVEESCLYTLMHAPREHHEALLRDLVIPVVREIRDDPELTCIFFARYSEPDWQLRFRVLGAPSWVEERVKPRIEAALAPAREAGLWDAVEFASYQREWERYGGTEGMRIAERLFFLDTLACLDLIDAERRGGFVKTRREYSLLFVEKFLDLVGFDRDARIAYYAFAHSWPIDDGTWNEDDLRALDAKFVTLEPSLVELLRGEQSRDAAALWGGDEPAAIAAQCLEASRPAIDELLARHRDGSIPQELLYLVWSYTHMHCNRLGIDAMPEAILRYFMWRLYTGAALPA
jgi:thiopeptide-type bacteriocin biosynthesis protein